MNIRDIILSEIRTIAEDQNRQLAPLTDDLSLLDSGLDSLALAILVARLEDTLGVDPFTEADGTPHPVTLGDFISFYDNAAART
jgi:acyl carrier protein